MIPTIAIPNLVTPPSIQTESVVGVPTETSMSARIPFHAVPSSVAAEPVYHNGRGSAAYEPIRLNRPLPAVQLPAIAGYQASGAGTYIGTAFTSIFMTQLMGQNTALTSEPDRDLIASFFSARMQGVQQLEAEVLKPYQVADTVRLSASSRPEPTPLATKHAPIQQLAGGLAVASQITMGSAPAARTEVPPPRMGPSLIRPRGLEGYLATFSRNHLQLRIADEELANKLVI